MVVPTIIEYSKPRAGTRNYTAPIIPRRILHEY